MGSEYTQAGAPQSECARRLRQRISSGRPLLLDGATGTELERRGVPSSLPLWSAHALLEAPEIVAAIHRDYVCAGAEVLTANTFRTQRRTLATGRLGERAAELTALAVSLARSAATNAGRQIFVAGSAPPLEDCYRPDLVPDTVALDREHLEHAENLADAGVDLILVETMNSRNEAVAAARAAASTGLPFALSFVPRRDGLLLSGEPLAEALEAVSAWEPSALLVNCLPPSSVEACLPALQRCGVPFGVYANLGAPVEGNEPARSEDLSPDEFASRAADWLRAGARIVGGCCGTTPAHIRALAS